MQTEQRTPLLTAEELAARLNIMDKTGAPHRTKVLQYAREGKIPSIRISSKCIRFDLSAVEKALTF